MFSFSQGKTSARNGFHFWACVLNVFVIFSLLLTSCNFPGSTGKGQEKETVPTPAPKTTSSKPNNYHPPVYSNPVARTVEDIPASDHTSTHSPAGEAIKANMEAKRLEMQEKIKADRAKADAEWAKAKKQFESFKPAPNPTRTISHKTQLESIQPVSFSISTNSLGSVASAFILKNSGDITVLLHKKATTRIFTVTTLEDVDDGTCDSNCSLREAIYAANDNPGADIINFSVSGTIQLNQTLPYILDSAGLTIDGAGQTLLIHWKSSEQVFYVASGVSVTLQGIKVSGSTIYNAGTLTLKDSTFDKTSYAAEPSTPVNTSFIDSNVVNSKTFRNDSSSECPINSEGSLTISGSTLSDCGVYVKGTLTVTDSFITSTNRGYIQSVGTLTIANTPFNSSHNGYIMGESDVTITDSPFTSTDNSYIQTGGALTMINSPFSSTRNGYISSGGTLSMTNSSFSSTNNGYIDSAGDVTMTGSSFSSTDNGYIYAMSALNMTGSSFTSTGNGYIESKGNFFMTNGSFTSTVNGNNYSHGYIYSSGTLTMVNSPFVSTGESADGYLYSQGTIIFKNSTFTAANRGSISSNAALTIMDSAVSFNGYNYIYSNDVMDIANSVIFKGDIENNKTVNIKGNTLFKNATIESGDTGIVDINNGTLTISNSILRSCGSIHNKGILTSVNSTFSNCDIENAATLNLYNTILANESICSGVVADGNNNILETSGVQACSLTNGVKGNIIGSRAGIDANPKWDGNRYYFELSDSSPAIDAGDDSICSAEPVSNTSQNGVTRPLGSHCDIGSYEAPPQASISNKETTSTCSSDKCKGIYPQGSAAGPINTRNGSYDYSIEDISLPTSAGNLTFTRDYASLGIALPTMLSPGWTHNHDTRLIMPDDPEGEQGAILFKLHSSNRFTFYIQPYSTYKAAPGLLASLVREPGPSVRYIVTDSSQNSYTFDENGKLLTYADALDHTWEYSYNSNGILEEVSADGGSRYLSFTYNPAGQLESVADQTGRSVSYGYDESSGDLTSVTDVLNQTWTYTYISHLMTNVIDPDNHSVERTEYDPQGRAVRQYDGNDKLTAELTYNPDGTTTFTDALGNSGTHTYDARGTLVGESDAAGGETEKTYLSNFRPFKVTDALGKSTYLSWSTNGANLTRVLDAAGNQTNIKYNDLNDPILVVDAQKHPTDYEYEGKLLTKVTDALNGETKYTYTPEGYLETVTDPAGQVTSYTYNSHGQRTSMTTDSQGTTDYTYDDLGRLVDVKDHLDRVTHNEYDAAGRLIRVTRNYDPDRPQNDENQWNIVTKYKYDPRGNQTSVTDTYEHETKYEYDPAGRLVKTIDPETHETINHYDDAGNLDYTMDARRHFTYYFYDEAGRLRETKNALDGSSTTTYNPDGTVASTTDELTRTTYYQYDELKRVKVATLDGVGPTEYEYDELGNLKKVSDPLENVTLYDYNALGQLIKTTDPEGHTTESIYEKGRLIQTIDSRHFHTTYVYNPKGQLENVVDELGGTTTYKYDDIGRRTAVFNANEKPTRYVYDALDRVVTVIDPLEKETHTVYDALGQVLSRTDANGNSVEYTYTQLGQMETQKDAENGITTFDYDEVGNRTSVQDANTHTTYTEYDELNRPVKVTDPLTHTTRTVYDAVGQVITTYDALEKPTIFEYNPLGLQTLIKDPLGNETHYTYNAGGQKTSMTDANGVVTAYEYYKDGRLKAVIENYRPAVQATAEINVRTEYTYDENGNRLTIKDGNEHTTNFTYDELNRLKSESDPLLHTWTYDYDAVGNRISMTDANNATTTYTYDAANQLTDIAYGSSSTVHFTYDDGGRRTTMVDSSGTTTWDYDKVNRPIAIKDPFDTTVNYEYDAVGNRTKIQYPDAEVNYAFNPNNSLDKVTRGTDQTEYRYDPLGRVAKILRANNVSTDYVYDDASRLLSISHSTSSESLSSFQYTYDKMGNRTQAKEIMPSGFPVPTVTVTVTESNGAPMAGKTVYAFDGTTYTGYNKVTDANGQASITLPAGMYRFRVDVDGTQFWSGEINHCTVGKCGSVMMTVPQAVLVTVQDSDQSAKEGLKVYAFNGNTYTNISGTTNADGQVSLRLPQGSYRFRADFNGTQFWSGEANHCEVSQCTLVSMSVTLPVTVHVKDDQNEPKSGIKVYAFDGSTYKNFFATTDTNGEASFTLPEGDYRFRADFNGTQFWSSTENNCSVPVCREDSVTLSLPFAVTVKNTDGAPQAGIKVYAFNGTTYTNYSSTTDADGKAAFTLPYGSYRFRADFNGTQFWSGANNHCDVPGCTGADVTVTNGVLVTVKDTDGIAKPGIKVYAFNGSTYTNYSGTTNASGQVTFTLPQGSYRFRADLNGTQFWSGAANHCDVPGCSSADVTVTNGVQVTVKDTNGAAKSGIKVYAFNGSTYTNYNGTTDANGQVTFTLPQGSYRFRADLNGTQFWSGAANHCDVPGCSSADVTVTNGVLVTVQDTDGAAKAGIKVYAFNGTTYTNYSGTTDANGQATFTLPLGNYRFRADLNGTQFWSDTQNHCSVPTCGSATVTVTKPLIVTVNDTDGAAKSGIKVYAFNDTTYTNYSGTTDANGQVTFTLPLGSYRFRADLNGTQFWSGAANHCTVPDCAGADVTITIPLVLTVQIADGTPQSGIRVYAFNGTTYTNYSGTTDASGQATFTLPQGSYRFRADYNGAQYWSGSANHCTLPGCATLTVLVGPQPTATPTSVPTLTPTPEPPTPTPSPSNDSFATPEIILNLPYTSPQIDITSYTNSDPQDLPLVGCGLAAGAHSAWYKYTPAGDETVVIDTLDSSFDTVLGVYLYGSEALTEVGCNDDNNGLTSMLNVALTGGETYYIVASSFSGVTGTPIPCLTCDPGGDLVLHVVSHVPTATPTPDASTPVPPTPTEQTSLQFGSISLVSYKPVVNGPISRHGLTDRFANGLSRMMDKQMKASPSPVTVTVQDTDGAAKSGIKVYAFDGTVYKNISGTTDANGQATFNLPDGAYRFRADLSGTQFWSAETNTCEVPTCSSASVTVTKPITVTVKDTDGTAKSGIKVYAFDGATYKNYNGTTDANGQVTLTLPQGNYRFRADLNGTQFWSAETNTCEVPTCTRADVTVTKPITVTVQDTGGAAKSGIKVYAFDGTTYTNHSGTTDANGQLMMTLPQGASSAYRFRADLNGTQFWSADSNNCTLPGCTSADVTVTLPLTVTVQSQAGDLYPNLKVYAFDGTVYTGFHGTTDANGKVTLTLPQGNYRFRADYDGVQFWSAQSNTCALPGCTTATVTLPGGVTQGETTIDYTYDPLYRLTAADYSTGDFYHYTYDAVGNRMTQQNMINGHSTSIAYAYDDANRLANVNDATYTYDANGNLRSDGVNDYTYDPANRLTSVFGPSSSVTYAYNGLGDRLSQNVNGVNTNYTLDLNAGLTQVLSDGTTSYTYGLGRISQSSNSTAEYFLSDALGSVRQLTDSTGAVTYAAAYDPYGAVTQTSGAGQTVYGFTGEQQSDDLVYLRARYLSVNDGRFLSRDTWEGKVNHPMSMNRWMYVEGNPVNATDPSGFCKNANGSVNWLEWPWGPWWPCNTGQVNNLPATNPPTTTNTPIPPTLTPCSSKIVLTPIPGITFSGEKWSDEEKAAVLEGVKWSMNFLGNKANSGLGLIGRGINFVLKRNKGDDTGAGMESFAWNALINVKLPREDVAIVYPSLVRTQAIHEMGHYVDYYAAKAIGSLSNFITSDDMSRESTYWVGEWEWAGFDQAGRGQWNYTGSADPNTLPSNYLWDKNLQLCARHNCPAEDFAETFTWMVYENERKINTNIWALDRSDIGYNYQKPSGNRTKAVSDIIKLLP